MRTILDTILDHKKEEVARLRRERHFSDEAQVVPPRRDFLAAIANKTSLSIIAEVKKASPSKGVIRSDFDPVTIAQSYEQAGASALSVLTDERFFQGANAYLTAIRTAVALPVLRKDFIIDTVQVEQTAAIGADAVLLIAAALDDAQLRDLYDAATELGVLPLVEIHSTAELDRVMRCDPLCIGINNRDLATFVTDIGITRKLAPLVPKTITVVAESGIESATQARLLAAAGVRALLVGEALMRLDDPTDLIRELVG